MRAILTALLLTVATQAGAFCIEPTIFMSTPMKPSLPWCVNEWDNTHTCDDWEIQAYYAELDNYRSEPQQFINALNLYVDEAVYYAQCRSNELE
jgi:hypothetical protein